MPPTDDLGISFAPTADAALMGPKRGSLEGVPQAIQILSMSLPKFLGARRALAPQQLLQASGAQGVDPFTAVMQTLAKALGGGVLPQMGNDGMGPLAGLSGAPAPAPHVIPGVDTANSVRPQGGGPVVPPPLLESGGKTFLPVDPANPFGPLRPSPGGLLARKGPESKMAPIL